jgi:hypothetical protein
MEQSSLSEFEKQAPNRARHRALIMQILWQHAEGLTTQQILEQEQILYGYTFLTDNRLRELRVMGWVKGEKENNLLRWKAIKSE